MNRRYSALLIAVATTAFASPAGAQAWLRDRSSTQGSGIRVGDFEVHPGAAVEVGYDSNYFNRAPNGRSAGQPVVDTARLRGTLQFSISTLRERLNQASVNAPPPRFFFSMGGALIYSEFLMNVSRLGRNREVGATADIAFRFNEGRPWSFSITDVFTRTAQPSLIPEPGTAGLDRDDNRAAAEVTATRPGGLLSWSLGYAFGVTYFEAERARALTNFRHEIYTSGRWRFLPRTALLYDGGITLFRYEDPRPGLANSNPVRSRIGLSGLITDRFALLALAGWQSTFFENSVPNGGTRNFDSVTGQLELRYFLSGAEAGGAAAVLGGGQQKVSSVAIGFIRDAINSYLGNFTERNRGYVSISGMIAQVLYVGADAGIAAIRYGDILNRDTGAVVVDPSSGRQLTSFTNVRADAQVFTEYRVREFLGFNATFQYLGEFSDRNLPVVIAGQQTAVGLAFQRWQALGGVRVFF